MDMKKPDAAQEPMDEMAPENEPGEGEQHEAAETPAYEKQEDAGEGEAGAEEKAEGGSQPPAGKAQIDPQTQEQMRRIGLAAQKIIFDKGVSEQLLQLMQASGDPTEGVARATMMVMNRIHEQAQGIPPQVLMLGSLGVAAWVIQLGAAAGLVEPGKDLMPKVAQALTAGLQQNSANMPQAQPAPQQGIVAQQMGA